MDKVKHFPSDDDSVIFSPEDKAGEKGTFYYIISVCLFIQIVFGFLSLYLVLYRSGVSFFPVSGGSLEGWGLVYFIAIAIPIVLRFIGAVLFLLMRKRGWIWVVFGNIYFLVIELLSYKTLIARHTKIPSFNIMEYVDFYLPRLLAVIILSLIFSSSITSAYSINKKTMIGTVIAAVVVAIVFRSLIFYYIPHG